MIENSFGESVPDPFQVDGSPVTLTVRLSQESVRAERFQESPGGVSTALQRFIQAHWYNTINENESFEAMGKRWRIGPVNSIRQHGGIIGHRAPLIEAGEVPEGET